MTELEIKTKGNAPKSTAELTLRAVLLGLILSVVMGAANVYLGLKVGMTVSASIPAAVLAMLILRGLFRDGTILEANQVQTAASAGESLAAGIIFTMPAMVMIGVWTTFDFWTTTAVAFAGGLLGILFMIPMRKVFVVEDEELKFPEGVACAAVLRAGDEGGQAGAVIKGGLIGVIVAFLIKFFGVMKGSVAAATAFGSKILYFGGDISPALIGVGFIVNLNIAVLIFIGGALGWLVGIPILGFLMDSGDYGWLMLPETLPTNAEDAAFELWSSQIRYVGVGAMVTGGLASIWNVRGGLRRAISEMRKAGKGDTDDISGKAIIFWSLVATVIIAIVYYSLTGSVAITIATTPIMLVMAFFFTAVASYIVGLVGNSNSPVSGMTITAVLFTGMLLLMFGFTGEQGMVATLGVAAVVCCAACTSGDVCNDLKTGLIVGASPRRQQMMQILGVAAAALVMAPILQLLHDTTPGGIGGKELPAPQAGLFAGLAEGFFGTKSLPQVMVATGAALGALVLVLDAALIAKKAKFRLHLMPIAVGMYLPLELATPILAGGVIAWLLSRGVAEEKVERILRPGVLLASGIIAGESLTGVFRALVVSAGEKFPAVQEFTGALNMGLDNPSKTTVTLIVTAVVLVLFYAWGSDRKAAQS